MNKKVFISSLVLVIIFLVAQYALKYFLPEQFVMYVQAPGIVAAGNFIDNTVWLYLLVNFVIGFVSDYLYFGAVLRKIKLPVPIIILSTVYNLVLAGLYAFAPTILVEYTTLVVSASTCYMFLVPLLYTNELRPLAVTYAFTYIAQALLIQIRDLTLLLTTANTLTMLLAYLESYLWAALCFVIFNKGGKQHGNGQTTTREIQELLEEKKSQRCAKG